MKGRRQLLALTKVVRSMPKMRRMCDSEGLDGEGIEWHNLDIGLIRLEQTLTSSHWAPARSTFGGRQSRSLIGEREVVLVSLLYSSVLPLGITITANALPNEAPDEVAAVVAPGIADEGVRPEGVRLLIGLNVVQSGGGAAGGDGASHCAAGTNVDALVVVVVRGRQFVVAGDQSNASASSSCSH